MTHNKDKEKYNEYMRVYIKDRIAKRIVAAQHQLGGKCVKCGATENLEFDHIIPANKSFEISGGGTFSEKRWQEELKKCQLLCKPCHQQKTLIDLGQDDVKGGQIHGTLSSYRYCKCDACKKAHTDYCREWKRNRKFKNKGL